MTTANAWAPVVENVRRALTPKGRAQLGQFVVEGLRLVERALRAGLPPNELVISERLLRHHDDRIGALLSQLGSVSCDVIAVPEGVMLELAEGRNGGLMFGLCDVPPGPSLPALASSCLAGAGPILVLVDVEEPGNVGALVRTALAAGCSGAVALGVSDPFHPKAVRTSMGSVFKLPLSRSPKTGEVIEQLAGLRRIGAVSTGSAPPWDAGLAKKCALFVGNEANGLPPEVSAALDQAVSIPMPDGIDSYSVNAAAAILLYECCRGEPPTSGWR